MSTTKIEWATKVWNPVTGCTKISEGCVNCYAERFAKRLQVNPNFDIKYKYRDGFKVTLHPGSLHQPTHYTGNKRIFVCSMGDLFHDDVPFEFIRDIFSVIHDCPQHTFMILTKRAKRMKEFFDWYQVNSINPDCPNVWAGVTVENQKMADERIPVLKTIPTKVKFVSCEPLLGPVDLININNGTTDAFNPGDAGINWVISGGETGHGSRPAKPYWFEFLQNQCMRSNTPFFFKSWGDWIDVQNGYDVVNSKPLGFKTQTLGSGYASVDMFKVCKKAAGNLLDGKQYQEFPKL